MPRLFDTNSFAVRSVAQGCQIDDLLLVADHTLESATLYSCRERNQFKKLGFIHMQKDAHGIWIYTDISEETRLFLTDRNVIELSESIHNEFLSACRETPRLSRLHIVPMTPFNIDQFQVGDEVLVTRGTSRHAAVLLRVVRQGDSEALKYTELMLIPKQSGLYIKNEALNNYIEACVAVSPNKSLVCLVGPERDTILGELQGKTVVARDVADASLSSLGCPK